MKFGTLLSAALALCGGVAHALQAHPSYTAVIDEVPGTNSNVSGMVAVFSENATLVAFAATLQGLEANLGAASCTGSTNACGIHIHSGNDCYDALSQGDHYFTGAVTEDPWTNIRYTTNATGTAYTSNVLNIGTGDLLGRAVVVHNSSGYPIGCGLIQRVPFPMVTQTDALVDPIVEAKVTVFQSGDTACFYASATNLERNIQSFLVGGDDCFARNGCGAQIRSGTDCYNETTQQGPHYNAAVVGTNPWERIGYTTTGRFGDAQFAACVKTGAKQIQGKVFLIHASDGGRVSCGLLELAEMAPPSVAPIVVPSIPTVAAPSAPTVSGGGTTSAPSSTITSSDQPSVSLSPSRIPSNDSTTSSPNSSPSNATTTSPSGSTNSTDRTLPTMAPTNLTTASKAVTVMPMTNPTVAASILVTATLLAFGW